MAHWRLTQCDERTLNQPQGTLQHNSPPHNSPCMGGGEEYWEMINCIHWSWSLCFFAGCHFSSELATAVTWVTEWIALCLQRIWSYTHHQSYACQRSRRVWEQHDQVWDSNTQSTSSLSNWKRYRFPFSVNFVMFVEFGKLLCVGIYQIN